MHSYSETAVLPYSPAQLFAMVLDIEKYPEFLPWCRACRILSHEPKGVFLGELIISFSHMTERYTSRVTPIAPHANKEGSIDVALVSGPFKHLRNQWSFAPHPRGCEISLELSFAFKSSLLDRMIGSIFARACEKMVSAFTARAAELYAPIQP